jgi:hypothetical protein
MQMKFVIEGENEFLERKTRIVYNCIYCMQSSFFSIIFLNFVDYMNEYIYTYFN